MRTIVIAVAIIFFAVPAHRSYAGDLAPPPGPIDATPGPEPRTPIGPDTTPGDADSLYQITQPGSYYMTGNITGVSGKSGIEISAQGVTLDLNGFELSGVPGSSHGVRSDVAFGSSYTIRNGSIRNWGGHGLDLVSSGAKASLIEGIRATSNGGNGIHAGDGVVIRNCTADENAGGGIAASSNSTISHCTARGNGGTGITGNNWSTISNCTASLNAVGIVVHTASGIDNSTAVSNQIDGIQATQRCMIVDCVSASNGLDGIRVVNDCLVRGNHVSLNGTDPATGANIHVMGTRNRIEGNNCIGADRGIEIDVSGNIFVRNTCSGNTTNWDVAALNFGRVLSANPTGIILGNSGGQDLGSSDSNANYTY